MVGFVTDGVGSGGKLASQALALGSRIGISKYSHRGI